MNSFEAIRDGKILKDNQQSRRITWRYPHDGCYARAALVNKEIFQKFIPIPQKIFAFGNLRVQTSNSNRGVIGWWYHVGPVVEVNHEKYVLYPAIEPTKPLQLKEWLGRMGILSKIKISICNTGA